jgi:hypothetical protein
MQDTKDHNSIVASIAILNSSEAANILDSFGNLASFTDRSASCGAVYGRFELEMSDF